MDELMEITVDLDDPTPPFAQLIAQIKAAVLAGTVAPGDPLPSIRQLANDLELNNKTVAKAYRLLERDLVVESRGYRGTFVHRSAKANSRVDLGDHVRKQLASAIAEFRAANITDAEIRAAFVDAMNERQTIGEKK
jgi:DNA-binding transcriptional regulator YhcF (GntR family)